MSTIKTSISIDKDLFDDVNKLAAELKLSRSQVFSQALRYFIEKNDDLELIKRINEAYSDVLDENETKLLEKSKKKYKDTFFPAGMSPGERKNKPAEKKKCANPRYQSR